jgi:diguanylate cyclase (GGDEF)-like protein
MKDSMHDRRLLVAAGGAVVALCLGVACVIAVAPALGVAAGVAGLVAGTAGVGLAGHARQSDARLRDARRDVDRLHRELDAVAAILEEEANRRSAGDDAALDEELVAGEQAFDAVTGLYDERFFPVLVQQQVAAARRSLRPVSVVIFEIDGMQEAPDATRTQALTVIGDVVRRTLRESDSACRIGDQMIGAILEDTPEAGAVWAAERVRGTLLASPVGDSLTLSAGVACYPTHALGAAELVTQSGAALEEARTRGRDRVELAPEA